MCKYLIHYFSGTGNTYHMVKNIESELKDRGYTADLLNIEKDKDKKSVSRYDTHIFCFPVYGFGTPSIMLKYISSLNIKENAGAAVICTSAGAEGQSLSHTKYLLGKKGFNVFFTDMVIYTYNFTQILNPQSKEIEEKTFKKAEASITKAVQKIIAHETSFKKLNPILILLSWPIFILFINLGRRILGKTFIVDDSCTGCGKCKNICPAKAITILNGRPKWGINCESCQRCINTCPRKSIQLSVVKLAAFVISELVPILILIKINKYGYHLSTILNIILYSIMFVINTILADILISVLENMRIFRKLFSISYTKKYIRNVAKGFNAK